MTEEPEYLNSTGRRNIEYTRSSKHDTLGERSINNRINTVGGKRPNRHSHQRKTDRPISHNIIKKFT